MGRVLTVVLRVASAPVGVGVGLWTAQLTTGSSNECPPGAVCLLINYYQRPTFATWQCALFGAAAAVTLVALSLVNSLTNALRVLSVPVGVGVGLWTAQLRSVPYRPPYGRCPVFIGIPPLTFAPWQCALFGAGAAVVVLLLSLAATRLPMASQLRAA